MGTEIINVNILGDTPKEQWLSAVGIFDVAISSNIEGMRKKLNQLFEMASYPEEYRFEDVDAEEEWADGNQCADTALKVLDDLVSEMKRLIEGMM